MTAQPTDSCRRRVWPVYQEGPGWAVPFVPSESASAYGTRSARINATSASAAAFPASNLIRPWYVKVRALSHCVADSLAIVAAAARTSRKGRAGGYFQNILPQRQCYSAIFAASSCSGDFRAEAS